MNEQTLKLSHVHPVVHELTGKWYIEFSRVGSNKIVVVGPMSRARAIMCANTLRVLYCDRARSN